MLKGFLPALTVVSVVLATASFNFASESPKTKRKTRTNTAVEITAAPVGLSQEQLEQIKIEIERSAAVQKQLRGTNYRMVSFEYVDNDSKHTVGVFAPREFRATFYDYTNDRTIWASGELAAPGNPVVAESEIKPNVDAAEIEAAAAIVAQDAHFASLIKGQKLRTFSPMPPITVTAEGERLINIGLESLDAATRNEVVSVSFKRNAVIRYESAAPPTSAAEPDACGVASGSGGSTSRGTAGQYQMTVSQGGTTLWEYLVIRPSASSGTMASGIELRDVRYKGKMVLKRAHVPVLNVEYVNGVCGPYRDWQYEEGAFDAPDTGAQNPAPGIRILAEGQIARTVLDSGVDSGTFRGVAIYRQNNETVMVSEMNAGWYRYIMEWRLADDGTIRPRYGFGATKNSCVCAIHTHHAYWRFDFDIVTPNNKIFQVERGRKFMTPVLTEATVLRRPQTGRSFLIQNGAGDEAYSLVPNRSDGVADNYGRSDFWFLRYKNVPGGTNRQNEIDDGWTSIGGNCTASSGSCININSFINGESLDNEDAVVWYGTHFIHADGANLLDPDRSGLILTGSHVVGPDIRPVRW